MIEFNSAILGSLILDGYKYIVFLSKDNYGLIQPTKEEIPEGLLLGMNAYQIGITEREVIEMAQGDDKFRFFVAEDVLTDKEKYNVLPR